MQTLQNQDIAHFLVCILKKFFLDNFYPSRGIVYPHVGIPFPSEGIWYISGRIFVSILTNFVFFGGILYLAGIWFSSREFCILLDRWYIPLEHSTLFWRNWNYLPMYFSIPPGEIVYQTVSFWMNFKSFLRSNTSIGTHFKSFWRNSYSILCRNKNPFVKLYVKSHQTKMYWKEI